MHVAEATTTAGAPATMPPLPLTSLLQTALPGLSTGGRAVVNALGCFNGDTESPCRVATLLGMGSRYQLARALRREGLPPLEELSGWARVLYWMSESEAMGVSLHHLSCSARLDSATAYRLVRRVTGKPWSELHRAGLAAAIRLFRDRCSIRAGARTGALAAPRRWSARGAALDASCTDPTGGGATAPRPGTAPPHHPTGVLAGRLPVSGCPFDVAIDATGIACVTRVHAAAVERVAIRPLRVVGSVQTGSAPTRVVFDGAGDRAYVTNQFAEQVGVIDVARARQVAAIGVPGHPMAAVLSLDGRTLFVTTNLDRLCAISLATGQVVASIPIPQMCTEIALDPSGRRLYVPTWRAGSILEVDVRTLQIIRAFHVGGKVQGVALPSDGRTLFAANEAGWVDVVQLSSGCRAARLNLGTTAFGVAISPDDAVLYVSLLFAGVVVIVDRITLAVVGRLNPGGKPRRISFDATGRAALIANEMGWVDLVR